MIKVIIADDEINVVNLICNLVNWSFFDMEIVAVAYNGVEALELIEKHAPDLVVTDIRMPGYDGIEMIERAKRLNDSLEFIIISGYRHFEYAQKAIRFGVHDYLLKPIKKDELSATLQRIFDRNKRKIESFSNEERLEIRRKNDIERLRSGFVTELISNKTTIPELTLESVNNDYHFEFNQGSFQVFIIKLDYPYGQFSNDAISTLTNRIMRRVHQTLRPCCYDLHLYHTGSRVYAILNYDKAIRMEIRKIAFDDDINVFESVRITTGLGVSIDKIGQLPHSLATAEAAIAQRLLAAAPFIDGADMKVSIPSTPSNYKDIETALKTFDATALSSLISRILEACTSGYELYSTAHDICRACVTLLRGNGVVLEVLEHNHEAFMTHADLCANAAELSKLLTDCVLKSLDEVLDALKQVEKKPVRLAKQYILEHYSSPITLEEVAAHVGFTPSYFSTLFKKESGRNFLEYLSEVRMDNARELLKGTNMTVAAICGAVGYSDIKHFTKGFKKHTGLRPTEYRKIFS